MIIKTKNLIIRDFQEKDTMGLLEYLSHPRVNCFADDRLYSEESALAYISNTPKDMLRYAVCLKEDDNLRSKRLRKRLGMRHEGCMKEFISFVCYPDGTPRYEDTCIYAILNKEWTEQREQKPNSLGLCRVVTDMHEVN